MSLCSRGLVQRLQPTVEGLNRRMDQLVARQLDLGDKVEGESEKFRRAEEEFRLREMVEETRRYRRKAEDLKAEMARLEERSGRLTQRAVALMETKQREAMDREQRRTREAEREEELVAKPAEKQQQQQQQQQQELA